MELFVNPVTYLRSKLKFFKSRNLIRRKLWRKISNFKIAHSCWSKIMARKSKFQNRAIWLGENYGAKSEIWKSRNHNSRKFWREIRNLKSRNRFGQKFWNKIRKFKNAQSGLSKILARNWKFQNCAIWLVENNGAKSEIWK